MWQFKSTFLNSHKATFSIKIKSSFIPKKTVKKWLSHLESKYPSLSFRFEYGNDVLIAQGKIKKKLANFEK